MANQTPKPIPKKKPNSAFTRPMVKSERANPTSLKEVFDIQILEQNPWGQFLLFIEESYQEFIKSQEESQSRIQALRDGIKILNEYHQESWGEILNRIPQSDRVFVDQQLYRYISKSKKLTPQEVFQESQSAIRELVNNAEYGFLNSENRDIGRISQLCDAIYYFQKHQSKTYLILSQLPEAVPEDAKQFFAASIGFKKILEVGPSWNLQDFGIALMKHFKVTRTAIKDEAASNLVLSIGEIERDLQTQISIIEKEKSELEEQLQNSRSQARQEAVMEIAHLLQNGRQPALDQIYFLINQLEVQVEDSGEAELSSEEALSVFIILRNLMKIFQELGIEVYPKSKKAILTISQGELSEYSYIEGTPFTSETDTKQVECINQGWRVGKTIITPAKVKERKTK